MHKFSIIQVLKKVVLQVVTYMLLEVNAKVKTITTTIATTIKEDVKTGKTSTKRMHVGLKIKKCNICHKLGHFNKVCQRRQQDAAQDPTQRRFIPKQKPSRFGGKQVLEIENDNLYIVDSSGNQIGITDYDSVNQALQEVNYAIIDSLEFSLDPGTGKLKHNFKHSNVEINQVLQAKTWKEAETTILMYQSDDKGKVTGRPKGMKSKLDTGPGANIMSLKYLQVYQSK